MLMFLFLLLKTTLSCVGSPVLPTVSVTSPIILNVSNFNLTLKCKPDHENNFHYTWQKKIDQLSSRTYNVNKSHFTLFNLRPDDAGEYRCIISNSTGRISSDYTTLQVYGMLSVIYIYSYSMYIIYIHDFLLCMYINYVGVPTIINISKETTIFENEKAILRCIATNHFDTDSSIKTLWYDHSGMQVTSRHGVIIYNEVDKVSSKVKSTLVLDHVNHTYAGIYICRAFIHPTFYSEAVTNLIVECKIMMYFYRCTTSYPYYFRLSKSDYCTRSTILNQQQTIKNSMYC